VRSNAVRELGDGRVENHAPFLDFPQDIQPDWGQAITQFHAWLAQELRDRHRVLNDDPKNDGQSHWPQAVKDLGQQLEQAQRALHPLTHNGQSYDDYLEKTRALSDRLVAQLLEEERRPRKTGP
jgi:hypothetical protein